MADLFYAVQADPMYDDWGYGSEDKETAIKMMMAKDKYTQIAVIDMSGNEPMCIEEIFKSDIEC